MDFRVARPAIHAAKVLVRVLTRDYSAREVSKPTRSEYRRFDQPYGILGVVDPDRVVYYREP